MIPGLIDSHMHAIRAALSFSTEVNWIGASSLVEAVGRIHEASQTMKPGAWLIVWPAAGMSSNLASCGRPSQVELCCRGAEQPDLMCSLAMAG